MAHGYQNAVLDERQVKGCVNYKGKGCDIICYKTVQQMSNKALSGTMHRRSLIQTAPPIVTCIPIEYTSWINEG